jgi:hypothetical protein
VAYALAGTILTNEALKQQGEGNAGVGAHRVANQVKEGVATVYEGVKSVDPHLRQSIENIEDAASFVVSKTISGSGVAVLSLFDTNSNQPVTETLAQVNQWYDNLPESQKSSVDLAMLLSSVAGGSYLSTTNKAINKPDVNLESVGNNSPGLSNAEARLWYNEKLNELDTSSAPTSKNAELLHVQRIDLKIKTRNAMRDREASALLDKNRPIKPFDYYFKKYSYLE